MKNGRLVIFSLRTPQARSWQNHLIASGYSVPAVFESPESGASRLSGLRPHAVVLDSELGGSMTALDLGREIRRIHGLPIIFLCPTLCDFSLNQGLGFCPDALLLEPFTPLDLQEAASAVLRDHDSRGASEAERLACNILNSLPEGIIATDLAGQIAFLNTHAQHLTGWSGPDSVGRSLSELAASRPSRLGHIVEPPGAAGPVLLQNGVPLESKAGELEGSLLRVRSLRTSPDLDHPGSLPDLFALPEPVFQLAAHDQLIALNDAGHRDPLFGPEAWRDRALHSLLPDSWRTPLDAALARSRHEGAPQCVDGPSPVGERWLEITFYPFATTTLGLLRDVSARHDADLEERRVERLEGLGHLARGFAHDFNNLLTVIIGNLSLLQARTGNDDSHELAAASQAALQAQDLIHQIMTFARGGAPIKGLVPFRPLLRELIEQRRARMPEMHYETAFEGAEVTLHADPKQLKRLLENILRNAEQAMNDTGQVRIACRVEADPDGSAWLAIDIQDSGCGMSEPVAANAFEPFFSTRRHANATGLGLTVSHSIAQAHGGSVLLHSREGEGTLARIRLPMRAEGDPILLQNLSMRGHIPPVKPNPAGESHRILILDDEMLIRQFVLKTLRQAGYVVDETQDGAATVAAYRSAFDAGNPYHVVVLDLTIENGMGGVEALSQIRQIDPDVIAIVSSGYSDDPAMSNPSAFGFSAVLPKPYEPEKLRAVVERLLQPGSAS